MLCIKSLQISRSDARGNAKGNETPSFFSSAGAASTVLGPMAAGSLASRRRAPTRVGDRPWSSREIRIHPIRVKTAIDRRVMVATRRLSNLLAGANGRNGAGQVQKGA